MNCDIIHLINEGEFEGVVMATNKHGVLQKNWLTAFVLSLFFGFLGADRFYLGKAGTGVLKIVTIGGLGIWYLIDLVMITTKNIKDVEWVGGNKDDKKKAWIAVALLVLLAIILAAVSPKNATTTSSSNPSNNSNAIEELNKDTKKLVNQENQSSSTPKTTVPAEYKSALAQASNYANELHLSKQGVYDQLVSQYGGKFTAPAAQYAIDNVKADWNANALAQAKTYQNDLHLSPAAVHDQLVSQYGGKFTVPEADYAIAHLND